MVSYIPSQNFTELIFFPPNTSEKHFIQRTHSWESIYLVAKNSLSCNILIYLFCLFLSPHYLFIYFILNQTFKNAAKAHSVALTFPFGRGWTTPTDGTFAVMAACQATGLKEVERVMRGEGKGSLHFFYEHPSVFMPFIHACCSATQLSQALQHHKSLLILLSFSISLGIFSVWPSPPPPLLPPLSQSVQLSWPNRHSSLTFLSLSADHSAEARPVLQQQPLDLGFYFMSFLVVKQL